jgi:hypothetical protein
MRCVADQSQPTGYESFGQIFRQRGPENHFVLYGRGDDLACGSPAKRGLGRQR